MNTHGETHLMVQVARMYYDNDLNQVQIAQRLKITRQKVSRLLIQARSQGIVRISISDPLPGDPQLEMDLRQTFRLHEVVLTAGEDLDGESLRHRLGMVAAEYVTGHLPNCKQVGIGWGRTIFDLITSLPQGQRANIHVVPLIGGMGDMAPSFRVNEIARGLAEAFGGQFRSIYVPAFTQDETVWTALMKTQEVEQINELWNHLDLAILGVGHLEFQEVSNMYFADRITPGGMKLLQERGAVGDICGRFFDLNGRPVMIGAGVIGMDLRQLVAIPEVIAIAGGLEKTRALLGAVRGGFVKTLITDTVTARAVLALNSEGR